MVDSHKAAIEVATLSAGTGQRERSVVADAVAAEEHRWTGIDLTTGWAAAAVAAGLVADGSCQRL